MKGQCYRRRSESADGEASCGLGLFAFEGSSAGLAGVGAFAGFLEAIGLAFDLYDLGVVCEPLGHTDGTWLEPIVCREVPEGGMKANDIAHALQYSRLEVVVQDEGERSAGGNDCRNPRNRAHEPSATDAQR